MLRSVARAVLAPSLLVALLVPAFLAPAAAHDTAHPTMSAVRLGPIEISGAFSRATLPNAPVAGGYMTLTNSGEEDDRLIAVSTPAAARGQVHDMVMQDDVMKMRHLAEGLVLPAGETVRLAPGATHLMFMDLRAPLVAGESVSVTLTFEKAGEITLSMPIAAVAADGPVPDHAGHDHSGHAQ